MSKTN